MPAQEAEEAADSQSGAEKANKRKAKKARQRAARAHAAAQTTEVGALSVLQSSMLLAKQDDLGKICHERMSTT